MLAPKEPSCIDELIKKPDNGKPSGQKKAVKLGYKITAHTIKSSESST